MLAAKPRHRKEILFSDLGDEVVLYTPDGRAIHVLNRSAHLIWELCDGEHSLEDMEVAIRQSFDVSGDREKDIAADIQTTLEAFAGKGLLQDD